MSNLREAIGLAVNAGSLLMEDETERAADRVAALGLSEALGSLLWRLKYGDQRHYREITAQGMSPPAFTRIALKLERWLAKKEARWSAKDGSELFGRFVRLVLADWLYDKCRVCKGRGLIGIERNTVKAVRMRCPQCSGRGGTQRTTPRGYLLHRICKRCCGNGAISATRELTPEKPRMCGQCNGLGIAVMSPAVWSALMGVSEDDWLRHWERRLIRVRNVLAGVDKRTQAILAVQLERI